MALRRHAARRRRAGRLPDPAAPVRAPGRLARSGSRRSASPSPVCVIWLLGWFSSIGLLYTILGWATLVFLRHRRGLGRVGSTCFWQSQDYVITTRRVIKAEGVINKKSADSSLEKINDAILEQGSSGGCSAGATCAPHRVRRGRDDYRMLHHATDFKKAMLDAEARAGAGARPGPRRRPSGPARSRARRPRSRPRPRAGCPEPGRDRRGRVVGHGRPAARAWRSCGTKGCSSAEEFEAKKPELLGRL